MFEWFMKLIVIICILLAYAVGVHTGTTEVHHYYTPIPVQQECPETNLS